MFNIDFGEISLDNLVDEAFDEIQEIDMITPVGGFNIGDRVVCKVKNKYLAERWERAEDNIKLTIISKCRTTNDTIEYIAYVAYDELYALSMDSTYAIRTEYADLYGIHKRYIGERGITIQKNNVFKIAHQADGMPCKNCDEFFSKAEPNQSDGTLICYQCRQNPYR